MASKLVPAWDTRTGKKRLVPENWFDHDEMSANLTRTDPKIPNLAPDGVNAVTRPDDRDFDEPATKPRSKTAAKDSNPGDTTNTPPAGDN